MVIFKTLKSRLRSSCGLWRTDWENLKKGDMIIISCENWDRVGFFEEVSDFRIVVCDQQLKDNSIALSRSFARRGKKFKKLKIQ